MGAGQSNSANCKDDMKTAYRQQQVNSTRLPLNNANTPSR